MKKIECVILDWAGTAVDYGCFAPVSAFIESFKSLGLEVTAAETRAHMGLTKIEEIRALFKIERVANTFRERYGPITMKMTFRPAMLSSSVCCSLPCAAIPGRSPGWLKPSISCAHRALLSVRQQAIRKR